MVKPLVRTDEELRPRVGLCWPEVTLHTRSRLWIPYPSVSSSARPGGQGGEVTRAAVGGANARVR